MSRLRRKLFSLGVGADDMSVVDVDSLRLLTSLPLTEYLPGAASPAAADWAPSVEAVLAQANVAEGGDVVMTVSDSWARYFMLNIPEGVGSLAELHMLAASRFETLFGQPVEGWQLDADWKASGNLLVTGIPARMAEVAKLVTETGPWRVRSVLPFSLRLQQVFHAQIPDECWLCCFGGRGVVALLVSDGEFAHVRRFPFVKVPGTEEINNMLQAEILRIGKATPPELCALGMLPELPASSRVGDMRLVVAQGPKAVRARPGQTAESVGLAMFGGQA